MTDIRKFFNDRASIWDQSTDYNTDHIRAMLMLSDLRPNSVILDVGCGTGMLEPYLLRYQPAKIFAVDFAENMIAAAKKKIQDGRVEFLCADIFDLEPDTIRCDACFFYAAFPHFQDPKKLVEHVASLVKPGGRLTICHPQGKKSEPGCGVKLPYLPAQGLINLLRGHFRLDVLIDNNVMFMVSGLSLSKSTC